MPKPLARIEVKVGSGGEAKRYECGQIWPGREKPSGGTFPPSIGIVREVPEDNEKYPKMTLVEALSLVNDKKAFFNIVSPRGTKLDLVEDADDEEF